MAQRGVSAVISALETVAVGCNAAKGWALWRSFAGYGRGMPGLQGWLYYRACAARAIAKRSGRLILRVMFGGSSPHFQKYCRKTISF